MLASFQLPLERIKIKKQEKEKIS